VFARPHPPFFCGAFSAARTTNATNEPQRSPGPPRPPRRGHPRHDTPTTSSPTHDHRPRIRPALPRAARPGEAFPELATPDSPSQRVSGQPLKEFKPLQHLQPMLSLDNTYSQEECASSSTASNDCCRRTRWTGSSSPRLTGWRSTCATSRACSPAGRRAATAPPVMTSRQPQNHPQHSHAIAGSQGREDPRLSRSPGGARRGLPH